MHGNNMQCYFATYSLSSNGKPNLCTIIAGECLIFSLSRTTYGCIFELDNGKSLQFSIYRFRL